MTPDHHFLPGDLIRMPTDAPVLTQKRFGLGIVLEVESIGNQHRFSVMWSGPDPGNRIETYDFVPYFIHVNEVGDVA